jgi:hydrogenase maturation protease
MKPILVVGLGNPLMGDEGIGVHIAEALKRHPQLPESVEVMIGGTDLLRLTDQFTGRTRVILIDALLNAGPAGTVHWFVQESGELSGRQRHAHQLSAVQSIQLLTKLHPELKDTAFHFACISVDSAEFRPELSAALTARLGDIVEVILASIP